MCTSLSITRLRVSIPTSSTAFLSWVPNMSFPTLPMNAVFLPSFSSIASTLHGAPPGLASSIGFPCALLPFSVKSINNSPNAVTSKALFPILYPPCCDGKKHSIRNKILSIVNNINLAQEREFVKQFSFFFCAKMLK